jgi:hypothetical protein
MLDDADANRLEPVTCTRKRRRPVVPVIAMLLAAGAVAGAAGAVVHVLLSDGRFFDPQPWITGVIVGVGTCFAVGVAQPWGEARRARKQQVPPADADASPRR